MTIDPRLPESVGSIQPISQSRLVALWRQFKSEFPTDEDCMEELCRRSYQDTAIKCRHCGSQELDKKSGARVVICRHCGEATWLTAGTFFDRIRLPRPWLGAIWLLEHGVTVSSCRFHKLAGVAYSTAWNIFNKLATVIRSEMGEGARALPSSLFSPLVCKRSRETRAKSHPLSEQEDIERNSPVSQEAELFCAPMAPNPASSVSGAFVLQPGSATQSCPAAANDGPERAQAGQAPDSVQMSGREKMIVDLLAGQEMHFDALCVRSELRAGELSSLLIMLELAGHVRRRPGDYYVCTTDDKDSASGRRGVDRMLNGIDLTADTQLLVKNVIRFVRGHFQGISRKYLQNYLAAYWCHVDRRRWNVGSLLQSCFRFGPLRDDEICRYVSPLLVRVLPCHLS